MQLHLLNLGNHITVSVERLFLTPGKSLQLSNINDKEMVPVIQFLRKKADGILGGYTNSFKIFVSDTESGLYSDKNINSYHSNDNSWGQMIQQIEPVLITS